MRNATHNANNGENKMSNLIDITEMTNSDIDSLLNPIDDDRSSYLKDLDRQIEGLKEALEPCKDSKLWGSNDVHDIERKYRREMLEILLKERALATKGA